MKKTHNLFGSIAPAGHSHLVPLRSSGAGSPLFCLPGVGGDAYAFREMAAAMPEGQPVYAIDMEWLCTYEEEFTIEQVAAFSLDVIREVQRSGPYYFCGYSFGGLVAYEMAMRLMHEGEDTRLLALLDTPNPALMSNLSESDSAQFRKTYLIDRLKKYRVLLSRGDIKAFTDGGIAFIAARFGRLFMPAVKAGFRMMKRPAPAKFRARDPDFLRAFWSYLPKRYAGSLQCFRVQSRGPEHDRDPSMGWNACVTGGVQVHIVPGDHEEIMRMPSARVVASVLTTYLDNGSNQKKAVREENPDIAFSGK